MWLRFKPVLTSGPQLPKLHIYQYLITHIKSTFTQFSEVTILVQKVKYLVYFGAFEIVPIER